jgi:hypothetical protein
VSKPERKAGIALAQPYKRTPAETAAVNRYSERTARRPPARIKRSKGETSATVRPDHPDLATGLFTLMGALGTARPEFMHGLLKQVMNAASQGQEVSEADTNFVLSVINGIEPRDEVESMLGAQMAVVHTATMTFARRLAHVENLPQQEGAERAFNKLARTFTTQMEALKRYRSTGQQTVRVERVSVEAGGQAIVGSVTTSPAGGGGDHGK